MTKRKLVRYNGGTESQFNCSSPSILKKGKIYQVEYTNFTPYGSSFKVNGIKGYFNALWFDEITSTTTSYFVLLEKEPKVGQILTNFYRFNVKNGTWEKFISSSKIVDVEIFGDTYIICTENSIYISKFSISEPKTGII